MSTVYELSAEIRLQSGKAHSRRVRRLESKVPAVVYGGEKTPELLLIDHDLLNKALENEGFYSHILTLKIDGKNEQVVLKDLHRHPSRPRILHADFLRVSSKTKITMSVPLHFVGGENSPGVKSQGGIVSHLMTEVEVRCLPGNLPEFIEVDLSKLSTGDTLHLSDLKLPKGVEIVALLHGEESNHPVASIHKPTVSAESTEAAGTPEAGEIKPEGKSEG